MIIGKSEKFAVNLVFILLNLSEGYVRGNILELVREIRTGEAMRKS